MFSFLSFSQDDGRIKLYNAKNGKEKMVKYSKIDQFNFNEPEEDDLDYSYQFYSGGLVKESVDSLFIRPDSYSYYRSYLTEGVDSTISIDENYYEFDYNIGISKKNISTLTYTPNAKFFGFGFAYISLMSAMMVAPLVSLKYFNKGTFNTERYLNVAKFSLLGVAAGVSFSLFFPDREYTLESQF